MRPVALAALAALAVLLAGCQSDPGARAGRAEATAVEERTVALDGRTLVLDGFAGDVRVETDTDATGARVRIVRRALGATEASARERLARVTVETGGDGELYQVVWRAGLPGGAMDGAEGLSADAVATVPPGTDVVVRTLAGGVATDGPLGSLDVGVGAGEIVVGRAAARRLRLDARAGDVTLAAAGVPAGAVWTAETAAGSIDFSAPAGASFRLSAETDAGRIVDRDLGAGGPAYSRPAGDRRTATVGAAPGGGGASVRLHTAAGVVTLGRSSDIDGTETGQVE